jgi:predicted RNA binding protein YcfA (HicA-like mRNA interferase family)
LLSRIDTHKCVTTYMTADELIRKLKRFGDVTVIPSRGKGGHIRIERAGQVSHIPTGSGELKTGIVHAVLRQLGLRLRDLR